MSRFLFHVPRDVIAKALVGESPRREGGYSDLAARVSLYLDLESGSLKKQRDYARVWGWTPSRVSRHWDEMLFDVASWAVMYGWWINSPLVARLPDETRDRLLATFTEAIESAQRKRSESEKPVQRQCNTGATRVQQNSAIPDDLGGSVQRECNNGATRMQRITIEGLKDDKEGVGVNAHAHEPTGFSPSEHLVSSIYQRATGRPLSWHWTEKAARRFTWSAECAEKWEDICHVWADSPTRNPANVLRMLDDLEGALAEAEAKRQKNDATTPTRLQPSGQGSPSRNARERASGLKAADVTGTATAAIEQLRQQRTGTYGS